jgi:Ni2+-binding GTPase involved in maturation of urease and hydrogenase
MVIFRMALLLGPPSSGKTTMLMALAGKLHRELRVCFMNLEAKSFSVY